MDQNAPGDELPTGPGRGCRGALGEARAETANPTPPRISIDLTKRSDVALVHRAVVNGWDVSDEMRDQICEQLPAALELASADVDRGNFRRLLKLGKLMLVMEATNQVADGIAKKRVRPRLRRRYPDCRQARPKLPSDQKAALEEVLRKVGACRRWRWRKPRCTPAWAVSGRSGAYSGS